MRTPKLPALVPYLSIFAALLVLFLGLSQLSPVRVGDGSEYYGLYYAWELTRRPWMTSTAYDAYDALLRSAQIAEMVPRQVLETWFEALKVGATADFNHFWFYSLLAALCGKVAALAGIGLTPHGSFLALHFVLFFGTAAVAYRYYRWTGIAAVGLMLLASPMLWFIDKVHTEFMTVCLVLTAVILMSVQRYLAAAMFIALAAPQNPSFALVACIPLFYRVTLQPEQRFSLAEVAMVVTIVLAVLAHPVYYFSRYGVVTPQLLAGGASLGANLWTFYIWIVDPDLGLLPNWPLGLLVLLAGLVLYLRKPFVPAGAAQRAMLFFLLACMAINFFAHSSTTNLNSGATPGLARYALWYLPLAFPVFVWVIARFTIRSWKRYAAFAVVLVLVLASLAVNNPRRHERYHVPSILSAFIQTRAPWLYNPPAEVFLERYSGIGEGAHTANIRALIGPDCRKTIVLPGAGRRGALAPKHCMMDANKLNDFVNSADFARFASLGDATEPRYLSLPPAQSGALSLTLAPGPHGVGETGDGRLILDKGWSGPEQWGVWSDGKRATLLFPCNEHQYYGHKRPMTLTLALRPFGTQAVTIHGAAGKLWEGTLAGEQAVTFAVPAQHCQAGQYEIELRIPNAASPQSLGMSGDTRRLGVGLAGFEIKPH